MNRIVLCVVLILAAASTEQARALSTDKDQPMEIEADQADIDDKTGVSVFRGNVVIIKGSIRVMGDEVTAYRMRDGRLDRVVATGKLASYRQRPENKDADVVAHAQKIEYFVNKDRLILLGKAKVTQSRDTFTGDRIDYDIAADLVTARRAPGSKERVRLIIQPKTDDRPTR